MRFLFDIKNEKTRKKAIIEYMPMQLGDVYQTYADIKESEEDFGYCPQVCLSDGIEKFARWFIEKNRETK